MQLAFLAGCAATPAGGDQAAATADPGALAAALQRSEWLVEEIGGAGLVDRSRVTLNFAQGGTLFGKASCNSYRATYALAGNALSVSQAITTRMACAPALMQQEARFLALLAGVHEARLSADGTLTLGGADGTSIRARPAQGASDSPR